MVSNQEKEKMFANDLIAEIVDVQLRGMSVEESACTLAETVVNEMKLDSRWAKHLVSPIYNILAMYRLAGVLDSTGLMNTYLIIEYMVNLQILAGEMIGNNVLNERLSSEVTDQSDAQFLVSIFDVMASLIQKQKSM